MPGAPDPAATGQPAGVPAERRVGGDTTGGNAAVPALATHGLGVTFGGVRIVEDVSLRVRAGELLAVIGPNGAGKTTLLELLSGRRRPSAGRVELGGQDVTRLPPFRRARAGLARGFQVASLFPTLTVLENVRVAAQARRGGNLALWRRVTPADPAVAHARAALAAVGLAGRAGTIAAALPHGEKRKLELAVAAVGRPRVLLLDEPTAGMAMEDLPGVIEVVRGIRGDGATVVMVEHRMELVVDLADRVAVMHHGRLLACDVPARVMADPTVQSAYLGAAHAATPGQPA